MFVIFPKQNISEDKSSYFFFTFTLCPGLEKVSPLSKNASLRARIYIGQPTKYSTRGDAIYVIRHKQFSTYKMEL